MYIFVRVFTGKLSKLLYAYSIRENVIYTKHSYVPARINYGVIERPLLPWQHIDNSLNPYCINSFKNYRSWVAIYYYSWHCSLSTCLEDFYYNQFFRFYSFSNIFIFVWHLNITVVLHLPINYNRSRAMTDFQLSMSTNLTTHWTCHKWCIVNRDM